MKFLPSFKSAKAIALAAATIATAIAGSVAPSQASRPQRIIQTAGQPEIVIFESEGQSVASGCQGVSDLWKGLRTQQVSPQEYQKTISSASSFLTAHLYCNSPNKVKGYISPSFPNAGVIVTDGKPLFVTTRAFFSALGITPTQLNKAEGDAFIKRNANIFTNVVLEPDLAARTSSISIANQGAYVARYTVRYDAFGVKKDTFDVPVGKKAVFNLPSQARNIAVLGEYYTGIFNEKKTFFNKQLSSLDGNICYTTTGTVFNPRVNDSCH
jgi:hypothetical protein